MEVVILGGSRQIGRLAADAIEQLVRRKPGAVLGLATGSSPLPVYDELAARYERGLDFSSASGFALDEYVGLPAGHPESYREVIRREFTNRVNIAPENDSTNRAPLSRRGRGSRALSNRRGGTTPGSSTASPRCRTTLSPRGWALSWRRAT